MSNEQNTLEHVDSDHQQLLLWAARLLVWMILGGAALLICVVTATIIVLVVPSISVWITAFSAILSGFVTVYVVIRNTRRVRPSVDAIARSDPN